jgi:hypothetical protein
VNVTAAFCALSEEGKKNRESTSSRRKELTMFLICMASTP